MKPTLARSVTVNGTEKTNRAMPSWITRNFAYDMCLPYTTLHGFGRAQVAMSFGGRNGTWSKTGETTSYEGPPRSDSGWQRAPRARS